MADHCRQWCARHLPIRPEGAIESVGAFFGPFALATGIAGTAGGSGKGLVGVAALIWLVSRSRVSLVTVTRRLLLPGSQVESFPTCPPNGWRSWPCCCPVLVASEYGEVAGPCGLRHCWRLREPS